MNRALLLLGLTRPALTTAALVSRPHLTLYRPLGLISYGCGRELAGIRWLSQGKRVITLEEIGRHRSETDCWIAIHGKVYDITDFVGIHPGGDIIMEGAGTDATELFEGTTTALSITRRTPMSRVLACSCACDRFGPLRPRSIATGRLPHWISASVAN